MKKFFALLLYFNLRPIKNPRIKNMTDLFFAQFRSAKKYAKINTPPFTPVYECEAECEHHSWTSNI